MVQPVLLYFPFLCGHHQTLGSHSLLLLPLPFVPYISQLCRLFYCSPRAFSTLAAGQPLPNFLPLGFPFSYSRLSALSANLFFSFLFVSLSAYRSCWGQQRPLGIAYVFLPVIVLERKSKELMAVDIASCSCTTGWAYLCCLERWTAPVLTRDEGRMTPFSCMLLVSLRPSSLLLGLVATFFLFPWQRCWWCFWWTRVILTLGGRKNYFYSHFVPLIDWSLWSNKLVNCQYPLATFFVLSLPHGSPIMSRLAKSQKLTSKPMCPHKPLY